MCIRDRHIVILNLSNQSGKEVHVDYQIEISSSAVNGEDYAFQNGTSFFPAGKTRDTLDITLINDTIDEPSQTLILSLLNPKNSTIGMKKSHTVKINDDDNPPFIYVVYEKGSGLESDSSRTINYSLSTHSEKEISVR